ncbi:type VII secretion protein EccB [Micromonospora sp. DR5-3]|uniref:type VII secretion protein EccB n=1 Tax=unclassified Micromonospora TaxID=2617518 RepID=UPI0011D3C40E|nr:MULTISPECIES: type VII secretion protein EccB [unclassified Micromonospora]MCW3814499.1 type VII secretion protein EccB [Micromonospora sp. DR5-3]TYC22715.1 type VII secretion protein EccB [Micromonospora sp. MP36]
MRTRRDQVQAYRFVTRRIVSALLSGDPETNDLPMRRLGMAVFGSVIAAAVVLGGAGAYGQLTGNAAPLESNTLVIERETGATYVFTDGVLHPTLNYASARLILDEADPTVRTMSQASIKERPRGRAVGIVGAPDDVPDRKSLVGLPWSVCDVPDPADPQRSTTRLVIDRPLPGGTPLTDRAVLVRVNDARYLLTGGSRLRVVGDEQALVALKMAGAATLTVGQQLLNAVPVGPALRKPTIDGDGSSSGLTVGDRPAKVGQVYRAAGNHYVLTKQGLVAIKEVTALLLLGGGGQITDITPDQAGQLLTDQRLEPEGLPDKLPTLHEVRAGRTVLCASYRAGAPGLPPVTTLEAFDQPPAELSAAAGVPARQTSRDAVRTAESVLLPGGKGVLVQPTAGESGKPATGATVYLITAQGVRYPLGPNAKAALGYGDVTPLAVPASLLALVPTGPTLARSDALAHFDPGAAPSGSATNKAGGDQQSGAGPAQGG